MKKKNSAISMVCAMTLGIVLAGCSSSNVDRTAPGNAVTGVAAYGAPISGSVTVKDASVPSKVVTTATKTNGQFMVNTIGLTPPFILTVDWTDSSGANTLYSFAPGTGRTNINPISNVTLAAAAEVSDPSEIPANPGPDFYRTVASRQPSVIKSLMKKLANLFALYGTSQNPVSDEYEADHTGLDALFDDVKIAVSNGIITVTNKATGGVIFTAPVNNIDSGTFTPGNMPAGPGGSTACTYAYSGWGVCQSDGTQTRTVTSSSPAGCTGTPVLSQACTYVPPTPSPCTYTYGTWGACQSTNVQIRDLLSSSPAGCTGTPVLSRACTYVPPVTTCTSFTYSAWGACQPNNTQTRTELTASPAGCTGGTPILSQACTYVPPVTTCTSFTYSAWGACQPNNTQTRTELTASPAVCTGGTPVLSQACTYTPPSTVTKANVTSSCTVCHGLTSNTTVFKSGGYTVTGRTAANWLSTVNSMVSMGASLAPGTTAQDYANFLASAP